MSEELTEEQIIQAAPSRIVGCECYYIPTESDPRSNMISAVCRDCWRGASYDPEVSKLEDGRIVPKGSVEVQ